MIIAQATPYPNFMSLEIIYPDTKQHEFKNVATLEDANRLIYFLNRKYILEKLKSWLKQRRFAIQMTSNRSRSMEVAKMLVLLNYYDHAGLHVLCAFITKHRSVIETLVPPLTSVHYNHYQNQIKPIIDFCQSMS